MPRMLLKYRKEAIGIWIISHVRRRSASSMSWYISPPAATALRNSSCVFLYDCECSTVHHRSPGMPTLVDSCSSESVNIRIARPCAVRRFCHVLGGRVSCERSETCARLLWAGLALFTLSDGVDREVRSCGASRALDDLRPSTQRIAGARHPRQGTKERPREVA